MRSTITIRLAVTISTAAIRLTVAIGRAAIATAVRLAVAIGRAAIAAEAALSPAFTRSTIAVRLAVTIATAAIRLTVTIGRAAIATKAALSPTLTRSTITIRLTLTAGIRLTFATAEPTLIPALTRSPLTIRLTVAIGRAAIATEAALSPTLTRSTITIRLTLTAGIRLTLTTAEPTLIPALTRSTLTIRLTVTVFPGTEPARIAARVARAAERGSTGTASARVVVGLAATVAIIVLSHAGILLLRADHWRNRSRSVPCFVSYATRNQALRSPYISPNSRRATRHRLTATPKRARRWRGSQRLSSRGSWGRSGTRLNEAPPGWCGT
ncbi:hypothetical protein SRABI26_00661 [Arthrobacter sp. Bi26]|nr:hypothetical protein SRABI26_00661 [Arthrobacter sp. Bi26]